MRGALRSLALFAESALFTAIVPGTVIVWLPALILAAGAPVVPAVGAPRYAAALLALIGVAVYFWCLYDFATSGRGIPAPIDHPKRLVVRGPYRFVRNPMYLGILCVLLGEDIFFSSRALFLYAIVWLVVVQGVVVLYEEPTLRTKFGPEYDRYRRSVRRWLPGRRYSGNIV